MFLMSREMKSEQCGRSEVWYWAVIRLPDGRTHRRGPRNSNKRSPFISPHSPCNWPPKLAFACQLYEQFHYLLCRIFRKPFSAFCSKNPHCLSLIYNLPSANDIKIFSKLTTKPSSSDLYCVQTYLAVAAVLPVSISFILHYSHSIWSI